MAEEAVRLGWGHINVNVSDLDASIRFYEKLGFSVDNIPLSTYRDKSYYFMRTDSLDRFGTRLEKRFTKVEIEAMMKAAGLGDVSFSERAPHWVAIGYKK